MSAKSISLKGISIRCASSVMFKAISLRNNLPSPPEKNYTLHQLYKSFRQETVNWIGPKPKISDRGIVSLFSLLYCGRRMSKMCQKQSWKEPSLILLRSSRYQKSYISNATQCFLTINPLPSI